jgi:hypothetical protein
MTSPFDERLDEILMQHREWMRGIRTDHLIGTSSDQAKAALRTLFLDLIAEAKPEKFQTIEIEWARGWRNAIDKFENNLIQAINGGKK